MARFLVVLTEEKHLVVDAADAAQVRALFDARRLVEQAQLAVLTGRHPGAAA